MSDARTTIAAGGDPFLSDDELRVLGGVVAYGALVEAVAAGMHGALTTPVDDPSRAWASSSGLQIGRLLRELAASDDAEVVSWARAVEPPIGRRHELVHTAWMIRATFANAASEAIFGFRTHKTETVTALTTPGDLVACRDDLRRLWQLGRDINARLHQLAP